MGKSFIIAAAIPSALTSGAANNMGEEFPIIEIMPLEESLRLTAEERIRQNDIMVNRWLEFEIFMKRLLGGWHYIHSKTCPS